jgi:hypothetical protein
LTYQWTTYIPNWKQLRFSWPRRQIKQPCDCAHEQTNTIEAVTPKFLGYGRCVQTTVMWNKVGLEAYWLHISLISGSQKTILSIDLLVIMHDMVPSLFMKYTYLEISASNTVKRSNSRQWEKWGFSADNCANRKASSVLSLWQTKNHKQNK